MFFSDSVGAYREARRVLRPGGTYLFNLWNDIEDNEFALCVTEAMNVLFPDDPPSFLAQTPLGHRGSAEIEAEWLERATSYATEALRARFGDGPIEGRISAAVISAN